MEQGKKGNGGTAEKENRRTGELCKRGATEQRNKESMGNRRTGEQANKG